MKKAERKTVKPHGETITHAYRVVLNNMTKNRDKCHLNNCNIVINPNER
jgi:hypothetical protein